MFLGKLLASMIILENRGELRCQFEISNTHVLDSWEGRFDYPLPADVHQRPHMKRNRSSFRKGGLLLITN